MFYFFSPLIQQLSLKELNSSKKISKLLQIVFKNTTFYKKTKKIM